MKRETGPLDAISTVSHELKTPLTALSLGLQQLYRVAAPEGSVAEKHLHSALKQVDYLIGLVESLSQATAENTPRISLKSTKLTELVRECAFRYFGDRISSIHLDLQGSVEFPCDPLRIQQVLMNLISNALKYGRGKPIRVSLRESEGVCEIAVQDQGSGIAPEHHALIFEPFQRIQDSPHVKGLGLGLSIVKQIVDAHHGSIEVISAPGQGSTFIVSLRRC